MTRPHYVKGTPRRVAFSKPSLYERIVLTVRAWQTLKRCDTVSATYVVVAPDGPVSNERVEWLQVNFKLDTLHV